MALYIYHVSQNELMGYDTYSDFVVIAEHDVDARNTHPNSYVNEGVIGSWKPNPDDIDDSWPKDPKYVKVTLIGKANLNETARIVCTSFHAG